MSIPVGWQQGPLAAVDEDPFSASVPQVDSPWVSTATDWECSHKMDEDEREREKPAVVWPTSVLGLDASSFARTVLPPLQPESLACSRPRLSKIAAATAAAATAGGGGGGGVSGGVGGCTRSRTVPAVVEIALSVARAECLDPWVSSPQTHQAASALSNTKQLMVGWSSGPVPAQLSAPGRCSPLLKVTPSDSPHPLKIISVASKQHPSSVQPTLSPTMRVSPELPKKQERPALTERRAKVREAWLPVPSEKPDQNRPVGRRVAHSHVPDFLRCRRSERAGRSKVWTARAPRVSVV